MRTLRYYFEKELIPGSELAARRRSACVRWRTLGAHRDFARPRPDDEGRREPARAQARATVLLALCGERAAGVDSPPGEVLPPNLLKGPETTRVQLAASLGPARLQGCFALISYPRPASSLGRCSPDIFRSPGWAHSDSVRRRSGQAGRSESIREIGDERRGSSIAANPPLVARHHSAVFLEGVS